jgi:ubiquinone/menaquinone biosynthesis C-methylase UbiE
MVDFEYPWWLSYGHVVLIVIALALWVLGRTRRWPRVLIFFFAALAVWSVTAFFVARFGLNINGRAALPTEHFLASRSGRVLDVGAGTGRSTLMVLEARPQTTVVAVDLFGESYEHHFGHGMSGQERLRANLRAAGVENRATIQAADMRKLPFEAETFDGVVSSYAMEHVNRAGSQQAVREAARVLKPGGEFLLMVIEPDFWAKFAFGPLLMHSGTRGAEWWTRSVQDAGLQVVEYGTKPGTLYILARKA